MADPNALLESRLLRLSCSSDTIAGMQLILDLSKYDSGSKIQIRDLDYRGFEQTTFDGVPAASRIHWKNEVWHFWRPDERRQVYVFKKENGFCFVQKTLLVHDLWPGDTEPVNLTSDQILRRQLELSVNQQNELAATYALILEERYFEEIWSKIINNKYWGRVQNPARDASSFHFYRWTRARNETEMVGLIAKGMRSNGEPKLGLDDLGPGRSISLGTIFFIQASESGAEWIVIKKNQVIDERAPLSLICKRQGIKGIRDYVERVRSIPVADVFPLPVSVSPQKSNER